MTERAKVDVRESLRPRAGRRFEPVEELKLADDAIRAGQGLPGAHRGLTLLKEATGPFGVPDLLAVVGPPGRLRERQALDVPPLLHQVDAGVVAAVATHAPRSLASVVKRTGWPIETIQRRIPHLLKSGALLPAGPTSYIRPAPLAPVGRLYAIEAKVRDWRRAIRQARTYSVWCDSYVIVMASIGTGSLGEAMSAVAKDNGGLIVAGEWALRPRVGKRSAAQRLWGSEHLVAATIRPIPTSTG